eukprot:TRINITY_DN249_c0_g1_i1.p1 TRINITY_DN249_c0_g1~~TRINITY_DN249_c0_g1_i1.p1  ORF type:complete len:162 (+),score=5.96 TRINITY_DN249_c0_g1_i1:236-721(+)
MVVPIASTMSYQNLCVEPGRCQEIKFLSSLWNNNICASCSLVVATAWTLMGVTVVIDTPLLFTFFVSLMGYYKGQSRKMQDVFKRSSCIADLTKSGEQRQDLETLFGDWANMALPIWQTMIQELYKRDLISKADRNNLFKSGKVYDFQNINVEARQRMSFF